MTEPTWEDLVALYDEWTRSPQMPRRIRMNKATLRSVCHPHPVPTDITPGSYLLGVPLLIDEDLPLGEIATDYDRRDLP